VCGNLHPSVRADWPHSGFAAPWPRMRFLARFSSLLIQLDKKWKGVEMIVQESPGVVTASSLACMVGTPLPNSWGHVQGAQPAAATPGRQR